MRRLAAQPGCAAVEIAGKLEPPPARYDADALVPLHGALARSESLRRTLADLDPNLLHGADLRELGDPELLCLSVNTPGDLQRAAGLIEERA